MVVPFFVSLSSFSRDDDTTTGRERALRRLRLGRLRLLLSLVSFVVCEEKRRDNKVPFFFALFFSFSFSLSVVFRVSKSEFSNPK